MCLRSTWHPHNMTGTPGQSFCISGNQWFTTFLRERGWTTEKQTKTTSALKTNIRIENTRDRAIVESYDRRKISTFETIDLNPFSTWAENVSSAASGDKAFIINKRLFQNHDPVHKETWHVCIVEEQCKTRQLISHRIQNTMYHTCPSVLTNTQSIFSSVCSFCWTKKRRSILSR